MHLVGLVGIDSDRDLRAAVLLGLRSANGSRLLLRPVSGTKISSVNGGRSMFALPPGNIYLRTRVFVRRERRGGGCEVCEVAEMLNVSGHID